MKVSDWLKRRGSPFSIWVAVKKLSKTLRVLSVRLLSVRLRESFFLDAYGFDEHEGTSSSLEMSRSDGGLIAFVFGWSPRGGQRGFVRHEEDH